MDELKSWLILDRQEMDSFCFTSPISFIGGGRLDIYEESLFIELELLLDASDSHEDVKIIVLY